MGCCYFFLACFGLENLEENWAENFKMWMPGSFGNKFLATVTGKAKPPALALPGACWGGAWGLGA